MRRISAYGGLHRPLEIRMTPMIDVVFLLLVFFVCTANFDQLEQLLFATLSVEQSGAGSQSSLVLPEPSDLDDVLIKIDQHNQQPHWTINERAYGSLAEVRQVLVALARLKADLPVILDAAPTVVVGDVIDVYDLCRQAGFQQVQFAAKAGP